MNLLRRKLVKTAVFVGTTASLVGTGVLLPQRVLGAYAAEAFAARVDHVAFYDKPFLKFERLLETYVAHAPRGFSSFRTAMPVWLREKLFQKNMLIKDPIPAPHAGERP